MMRINFGNPLRKVRGRGLLQVGLTLLALAITVLPTAAQSMQSAQGQPASVAVSAKAGSPTHIPCPANGQCFADVDSSSPFYDFINRIFEQDLVSGFNCGGAGEPCDSEQRPYYRPGAQVTRQQMAKFIDNARRLAEIAITTTSSIPPIFVSNNGSIGIEATISQGGSAIYGNNTLDGVGVDGNSTSGYGVLGTGSGRDGVHGISTGVAGTSGVGGESTNGEGVSGISVSDVGVYAESTSGSGVYATSGTGAAGYFQGDITVTGNCTGCLGPDKIDDPLDPANKYLVQAPVQSDTMMSEYSGNVTTDANGNAVATLPSYFQALNTDFRYQLTVVGQFAQAIVAEKVSNNQFSIKTDKPNVEVSWLVMGTRQDAYDAAHSATGEQAKPANEQGKYLHPTELGQPDSSGIGYRAPVQSKP